VTQWARTGTQPLGTFIIIIIIIIIIERVLLKCR